MNYIENGLLIALEGIDGAGKSSLAELLVDYYNAHDFSVVLTKEPGGTPLGAELRALVQNRTYIIDPRAEFLLFAADRAQHFYQVVLPALAADSLVISDR